MHVLPFWFSNKEENLGKYLLDIEEKYRQQKQNIDDTEAKLVLGKK